MNRVFADAFYFEALLNRADQYHTQGTSAARQLHCEIVTTEWVLTEVPDTLAESEPAWPMAWMGRVQRNAAVVPRAGE